MKEHLLFQEDVDICVNSSRDALSLCISGYGVTTIDQQIDLATENTIVSTHFRGMDPTTIVQLSSQKGSIAKSCCAKKRLCII